MNSFIKNKEETCAYYSHFMYQDFKQLGIPAPSYTILQSWQSGAVLCCWDLQLGEDVVANARKKVQDIITLGSYRKHQIAEIKVLSPNRWLISPSNSRTEYDSSGAADALPTSHKRALSTSADTLPAELKRRRVSGYIDGKLQNWVSRASAVTAITHTTVRSEDFFSGSSHRRARSLQSGSLGRAESITGGSLSVVYEGDNINPPSGGSISRSVASRHLNHLGLATDDAMSSTGQPGDRSATAAGGLPSAKSHSANAIVPASASPQAPDNDSDVSYMGSQLSDVSAALAFSTLSAPLLIDSEDLVSGVPAILPSSNTATGSAEDSDDQRLQDLNTALVNRVNDNSIQIIALLAEKRGTVSKVRGLDLCIQVHDQEITSLTENLDACNEKIGHLQTSLDSITAECRYLRTRQLHGSVEGPASAGEHDAPASQASS